MTRPRPSLRREKSLLREDGRFLAGCDEVGRGALAGPVSVGMVVVDAAAGRVPPGLADSKLLSASRREELVPVIHRWCRASAVGHASPQEVDDWGLTQALRLAGLRALGALDIAPDIVLLDGSFDWLTPPSDEVTQTIRVCGSSNLAIVPPLRRIRSSTCRRSSLTSRLTCRAPRWPPPVCWPRRRAMP